MKAFKAKGTSASFQNTLHCNKMHIKRGQPTEPVKQRLNTAHIYGVSGLLFLKRLYLKSDLRVIYSLYCTGPSGGSLVSPQTGCRCSTGVHLVLQSRVSAAIYPLIFLNKSKLGCMWRPFTRHTWTVVMQHQVKCTCTCTCWSHLYTVKISKWRLSCTIYTTCC